MIPFLIALGLLYINRDKLVPTPKTPKAIIRRITPDEMWIGGSTIPKRNRSYLEPAIKSLHRGVALPETEIGEMFEIALQKQDWPALTWLTDHFGSDVDQLEMLENDDESEELEEFPDVDGEGDEEDEENEESDEGKEVEEEGESETGDDTAEMPPVDFGGPKKSPLDGVTDEDWEQFLSAVRTKNPGYSGPKHIGQYEQHRSRLQTLGIQVPTDAESEDAAFATDIARYREEQFKMIADWSGDVVELDGVETPVTQSGVLGLLKAAGPKGAQGWLTNPEDRKSFPGTTEIFRKTNSLF